MAQNWRILVSSKQLQKRKFSNASDSAKILQSSVTEVAKLVHDGDVTPSFLTETILNQINRTSDLNLYLTVIGDYAMKSAKEADQRQNEKKLLSLIDGIPFALKDCFCTKGVKTTAGSRILENFISSYDATVWTRLNASGGVLLGKLNLDEFCMGSCNTYSAFGPTLNPYSPPELYKAQGHAPLIPGGSSGGSAAAVASSAAFFTLGSDTGGSVRQPAAFCGVVGFKPTYGRISRFGLIPLASSFDTVGILTRSVVDAAMIYDIIAGPCEFDSTCIQKELPKPGLFSRLTGSSDKIITKPDMVSLKGKKVGIPVEFHTKEMSSQIYEIWGDGIKMLQDAGAEIVAISLPSTKHALSIYALLVSAETSSALARYDGIRFGQREKVNLKNNSYHSSNLLEFYRSNRSKFIGAEVQRRILAGTFILSNESQNDFYEKGLIARKLFKEEYRKIFEEVDLILTPTCPDLPFPIDETPSPSMMRAMDITSIPANLAQIPAISVPITVQNSNSHPNYQVPIALQLMGPQLNEETVLLGALALEQRANFSSQIPSYVCNRS